jgi:hypothetical protein
MVNVTDALAIELYESFPAIVATTRQVPFVVEEIVPDEVASDSAQPVAVPPDVIAYVTTPLVVPPDVDIVSACEYGFVFDVGVIVRTSGVS